MREEGESSDQALSGRRGVCSGARRFQRSEPARSPAGRTDFSSRLHFCRRDEQDAGEPPARLPPPRASRRPRWDGLTPSCFSRTGFHGPGHEPWPPHSPTCSRCSCPGPQRIKRRALRHWWPMSAPNERPCAGYFGLTSTLPANITVYMYRNTEKIISIHVVWFGLKFPLR